jgi:hypothetical protein
LEIEIHTVSLSEGVEVVNALRGKGASKKKVHPTNAYLKG